ncbi:MAG TPA: GNAT family N-acetyltransferase, partial [Streptomyces sp.]|nr:GNAT family N-acetyltransferase [Streptomyces sp.]
VGVGPQSRRLGLGRTLYLDFFELARGQGRSTVRCITSPVNRDSIAFHTRMGFRMEPGDRTDGEVPTHTDYDGAGLDRVCFVHNL